MGSNLSIYDYFQAMAAEHEPRYRFAGTTRDDFTGWHKALHAEVIRALGRFPEKVALEPECVAQWQEDGVIKEKILFQVEKHLAAEAYVFRPLDAEGRLPAILACHGHGAFGKEPVMGNDSTLERRADIQKCHYDYGLRMAQAGFVTIAIDWRGFGRRNDKCKPHRRIENDARDMCNLLYLHATLFGRTLLGMNVHDGQCALDYLCEQAYVDPDRMGVMGLSFGGTMTTWMAITDARIKAADILCYSDRFANFAVRDFNYCGSQIVPGLFDLCDVPDLQGLIAPRPLLVEIGIHDDCFLVDSALSCYHEVEKIYQTAQASDKLHLDLFEGNHGWGGNKSREFFKTYLGS